MPKPQSALAIPVESRIFVLRQQKVILDRDLADLYGVPVKRLNEQVKRNHERFPDDFMFQLSKKEADNLTFQNGISSWGDRRTPPYAFTEQGVAMLSSVLRSDRAAQVNVAIIRTFVKLREILATHEELARKVAQHDRQIATLFEYVKSLLEPPPAPKKPPIGFIHPKG